MRGNNGGRSLEGCKFARRLPMLPNAFVVAGVALFVVADRAGAADEKMREKMVLLPNADAIKWGDPPPTLPEGTKLTVLTGDPSQPGPFVLRVYFPANTVVAPHTHKTAEPHGDFRGTLSPDG